VLILVVSLHGFILVRCQA